MITVDNLKEVLNSLTIDEIEEAIYADGDYIRCWLHVFNVGWHCTIESCDYDEDEANELMDSGNIFADKDEFLRLLEEVEHEYINQ